MSNKVLSNRKVLYYIADGAFGVSDDVPHINNECLLIKKIAYYSTILQINLNASKLVGIKINCQILKKAGQPY